MAASKRKRCPTCGKQFRAARPAQVYCCDSCRKEAARQRRSAKRAEESESFVGASTVESAYASLAPVLECVPESKRGMADDAARDLAFLAVMCQNLRVQLAAEGVVSEYSNGGGQQGTKQSPAWQTYNQALRQKRDYVNLLGALADGDAAVTDRLALWQKEH